MVAASETYAKCVNEFALIIHLMHTLFYVWQAYSSTQFARMFMINLAAIVNASSPTSTILINDIDRFGKDLLKI